MTSVIKKVSVKNKINVARVFSNMGDKEKGDSILKSLVGHPAIAEDTFMNNLLSRNIYGNQGEIQMWGIFIVLIMR